MELEALTAISPIDGRYWEKTKELSNYYSESALIKYRIMVEVEYLIQLSDAGLKQIPSLTVDQRSRLRQLYIEFHIGSALRVKEIEQVTNHDVKAVEYFIKENLEPSLEPIKEFIHFGLTSQDINNTAIPLSIKASNEKIMKPAIQGVIDLLEDLADEWEHIPMLARTHGQPASPTVLGKEIRVFTSRLQRQYAALMSFQYPAKFGGATGNFNAHKVAFKEHDWKYFGEQFVNGTLGLKRSEPTTQIDHYDQLAALFDIYRRINTILIDLCRDLWTYISMDYFKQKLKEGEVGSSAMPHKVNPIDFENAEGNLGIANALFGHLSEKLPLSRLQRDLTDSTVLRNVGVPVAHMLLSIKSITKGANKLIVNREKIEQDLQNNWAVVAEAIQTILRREKFPNPYEALKEFTRTNEAVTQDTIMEFVDGLDVPDRVKEELRQITPFNYTGIYQA